MNTTTASRVDGWAVRALLASLAIVALLMVPGGAVAEDPPPPGEPPMWFPHIPWDAYNFYFPDPQHPEHPYAHGYDPSGVPAHEWEDWWDEFYPWWEAVLGGTPEPILNCHVVTFVSSGLEAIVQNDGADDPVRGAYLRELGRRLHDNHVLASDGKLHKLLVKGELFGIEFNWFHPDSGLPGEDDVIDAIKVTVPIGPNGEEDHDVWIYAYDEDGFVARRKAVEKMVGHVMDDYRFQASRILADSSISNASAAARNTNTGNWKTLVVQHRGTCRAVLAANPVAIKRIVGKATFLSARLRVRVARNGGGWKANGVAAHLLRHGWREAGVTWNSPNDTDTSNKVLDGKRWYMGGGDRPARAYEGTPTASKLHTGSTSGWVEFDVTNDVRAHLEDGDALPGWLLRLVFEAKGGSIRYASAENGNGANGPQLLIETLDASGN